MSPKLERQDKTKTGLHVTLEDIWAKLSCTQTDMANTSSKTEKNKKLIVQLNRKTGNLAADICDLKSSKAKLIEEVKQLKESNPSRSL